MSLSDYTYFWQLCEQYRDYLYSRCLQWMGGNRHDAEDLFSRAMLKAWNQWPDYKSRITKPRAWLSRLIQNLCMDLHRERKREAEAIEVYGSALALSCNQGTQHHISGLIAVCKGDSHKAIADFNAATELEPDKIVHWLALGQVQKSRENPIGALRAFSQVLSLNPDDIVALIHSYDALMAVGDFQAARENLNRAIALAPDDFGVLQRQLDQRCGMRLVCGEEGKQTKKLIGSLLRQAPHAAEAYKSLAYYHLYRGDWAQGVGVLAEFAQQHPNNPGGWYYYGQCLFHTGEYQTAAQMMLKAYGLYPNDCEIYRGLCKILHVAGRLEELQPLLEEMLERFPERWSVWATVGRVLVESFQDIERGCSVSAKGIELQPELADAWFSYGRVLALALKHQEAIAALETGWQFLPLAGVIYNLYLLRCRWEKVTEASVIMP
ncbi:tetratricopeptide repeat protein [Nostoc sp. HG1]|nr:tetratricopeptide repeat protein [Nostoc sp. HG1]